MFIDLNSRDNSPAHVYYSAHRLSVIVLFALVFLYIVSFLLFFFFGGLNFVSEAIMEDIAIIRIVMLGVFFMLVFLLFTYLKKYTLFDDRIVISYLLDVRPKRILVHGPRYSRYFAFPYSLISSEIFFRDIKSVQRDSFHMNPCLAISLVSGKSFRLPFRDVEEVNRFLSDNRFETNCLGDAFRN